MPSAHAMLVLEQIAFNPDHGAARGISKALGFGRDKTQRLINQLREEGLIKTSTYKTSATSFGKSLKATEAGYHVLTVRTSILLTELNSNLILDVNSFKYLKRVSDEVGEGKETMNEWFEEGASYVDPEDLPELRRRAREKKQAQLKAHRDEEYSKRIEAAKNRKPIDWTIDNAVYEFCNRMVRWDISPWEGYRTRFKAAYAKARSTHGTNGEIEVKMMDRYFQGLDHEKNLKDPEVVWKTFIKMFGSLLRDVEAASVTPEKFEAVEEAADKQWENF